MQVRLTRKFATVINGFDLSRYKVGDLLDLQQRDAQMLVDEGWATFPDSHFHLLASGRIRTPRNFHAVQFFESDESLCPIVAQFVGEGFVAGEPAVIIAPQPYRQQIVRELSIRNFDLKKLQSPGGDLLLLDAQGMLSTFMEKEKPTTLRFTNSIVGVYERVCRGRKNCTVRLYGQMVDLLWQGGFDDAANRVEQLWNRLAGQHALSLLCGFARHNFNDAASEAICRHHTHVISPDGMATAVTVA
jgi:hypothetical protein